MERASVRLKAVLVIVLGLVGLALARPKEAAAFESCLLCGTPPGGVCTNSWAQQMCRDQCYGTKGYLCVGQSNCPIGQKAVICGYY